MLFRENEIARKAATSLYRKTCIFNRLGYHDLRSVPTWKAQRGAHFARSAQLAWSRDRISSTKSIKGVKPTRRAAGRSWRLAMVEVPDPAPVPTISAVSPSFIRPFIATVVVGRRGQRLTRPTLRPSASPSAAQKAVVGEKTPQGFAKPAAGSTGLIPRSWRTPRQRQQIRRSARRPEAQHGSPAPPW